LKSAFLRKPRSIARRVDLDRAIKVLTQRAYRIECPVCHVSPDVSCWVLDNGLGDLHCKRVVEAAFRKL